MIFKNNNPDGAVLVDIEELQSKAKTSAQGAVLSAE
jgi:hypothetical protein